MFGRQVRTLGLTLLAVAGAALVQRLVQPWTDGSVSAISFHMAVLGLTWYGGRQAGLLGTALAAVGVNYLYFGRPGFSLDEPSLAATTLFTVYGVLVSLMVGQLHWQRGQAEADARRLREKEAELAQHRRQLELVLHRNEESLAILAHELRNHLNPLLLTLGLIDKVGPSPERLERLYQVTARQCGHMQRLIEDLLDKARIAKGQVSLKRERLDLGQLVRNVADDHGARVQASRIALEVQAPAEPVWVDGDRTRLVQVLTNLVQNAAKFTDPGGTITLWVHELPRQQMVAMGVVDTGIGIAPAMLPFVFDRGVQGPEEWAHKGLGLGLTLVRRLVELHGGSVQVKSDGRGKGSEFICLLPLREEAPQRNWRPLRAAQEVRVA